MKPEPGALLLDRYLGPEGINNGLYLVFIRFGRYHPQLSRHVAQYAVAFDKFQLGRDILGGSPPERDPRPGYLRYRRPSCVYMQCNTGPV